MEVVDQTINTFEIEQQKGWEGRDESSDRLIVVHTKYHCTRYRALLFIMLTSSDRLIVVHKACTRYRALLFIVLTSSYCVIVIVKKNGG